MKNIKNIVIALLSIVIVGMVVIYFTILKTKSNVDGATTYYLCEKNDKTITEENMEIGFKQKVLFDNMGEVTKVLDILEYQFKDKDFYESFKKWQEETKSIKKSDDKNMILTIENEPEGIITNSSGEHNSIWIKSYLEMLEQQGYTCTK